LINEDFYLSHSNEREDQTAYLEKSMFYDHKFFCSLAFSLAFTNSRCQKYFLEVSQAQRTFASFKMRFWWSPA